MADKRLQPFARRNHQKFRLRVLFNRPVHLPVADKQDYRPFVPVHDQHVFVHVFERLLVLRVLDQPPRRSVGQLLDLDIDAVFVFQPVGQDFKL